MSVEAGRAKYSVEEVDMKAPSSQLSLMERLSEERKELLSRLETIDSCISLIERNPQFELILSEIKKVYTRP
jgi:hypothetical protein